jgi:hypothetical protein
MDGIGVQNDWPSTWTANRTQQFDYRLFFVGIELARRMNRDVIEQR